MATTFAEVKTFLAQHANGGLCLPANEAKLIDLVNEAQRRLYAVRPWIGVVAKYAVTVSGGTVTLPTALESAIKISSYSGTGATAGGSLITDDVHAFVHDNDSIIDLQYTPTSPRVYTINVSPLPTAVAVTGRKMFTEVTGDSSEMIITDVDALKLMLRALYYEDRGQLDVAKIYEDKAIAFLTSQTDTAIESARKVNYQTRLASAIPGSLDWVRCKLSYDVSDAIKIPDAELVDLINKAEEQIMKTGKWWGTIKRISVSVSADGLVILPTEVDSVLGASISGSPVPVFGAEHNFTDGGPGTSTDNSYPCLIEAGERLYNNSYVRVYRIQGSCPDQCVELLIKTRHYHKHNSNEMMQIRNYPAIRCMVESLKLRTANPELAKLREKEAEKFLDQELKEKHGGERRSYNIQMKCFGMGNIKHGF